MSKIDDLMKTKDVNNKDFLEEIKRQLGRDLTSIEKEQILNQKEKHKNRNVRLTINGIVSRINSKTTETAIVLGYNSDRYGNEYIVAMSTNDKKIMTLQGEVIREKIKNGSIRPLEIIEIAGVSQSSSDGKNGKITVLNIKIKGTANAKKLPVIDITELEELKKGTQGIIEWYGDVTIFQGIDWSSWSKGMQISEAKKAPVQKNERFTFTMYVYPQDGCSMQIDFRDVPMPFFCDILTEQDDDTITIGNFLSITPMFIPFYVRNDPDTVTRANGSVQTVIRCIGYSIIPNFDSTIKKKINKKKEEINEKNKEKKEKEEKESEITKSDLARNIIVAMFNLEEKYDTVTIEAITKEINVNVEEIMPVMNALYNKGIIYQPGEDVWKLLIEKEIVEKEYINYDENESKEKTKIVEKTDHVKKNKEEDDEEWWK